MKPEKKPLRCAIYTRKSTDHNLELEFNSLDAQREACEAYIKSQAHEGWTLVKTKYDDGAFSGATLDRPALQELLEAVRVKKIDIIVVYKVDRLTRSLADFAKLVELFDEHSVSFVSITQSFNTTTSMGRLTLNVLLSFAQFEREVIGERVRDKIAASKKKGIWVGGPVPAGYKSVEKKLVIDKLEAAKVRMIFERYLALGSLGALLRELDDKKIKTKVQKLSNGKTRGGCRIGRGTLAHLLRNRFYVGDVVYRGGINQGDHPAIVEHKLFDAVQEKLTSSAITRKNKIANSRALLSGLIFDDRGNPMSPSHTRKHGVRYRYYISQALLQSRKHEAGSVARITADQIERIILKALKTRGVSIDNTNRETIAENISRVEVGGKFIQISFKNTNGAEPTLAKVPWVSRGGHREKGVLRDEQSANEITPFTQQTLLKAIAKAKQWLSDLETGETQSFEEIARQEKRVERHVQMLAPLAFLAPALIESIETGTVRSNITVTALAKSLSHEWTKQPDGRTC